MTSHELKLNLKVMELGIGDGKLGVGKVEDRGGIRKSEPKFPVFLYLIILTRQTEICEWKENSAETKVAI